MAQHRLTHPTATLLLILGLAGCSGDDTQRAATAVGAAPARKSTARPPHPAADVDAAAIGLFEQRSSEWLATGRTYGEQRYSPLDQVTTANVSQLGVAWEADLQSPRFGIEATPVMADGVLYVTSSWGRV
ncbi:MAG TPA: hypothetical protein VFL17_15490, partial [Anaerolineae bacterium]|nr:hypothetical protein [Anaerolineae bacterium]